MKKIVIFLVGIAISLSIKAENITKLTCYSENGLTESELEIVLNHDDKLATFLVNGVVSQSNQNMKFEEFGNISSGQEDGDEAYVLIELLNRKQIRLQRNYDELSVDISNSNLELRKIESDFLCD